MREKKKRKRSDEREEEKKEVGGERRRKERGRMREKMKNREGAGGKLIGQVRSECRDVSTETHINKEYIDN